MVEPVKVVDIIEKRYCSSPQVVQKFEFIDALWGVDNLKITDEHIQLLKEGKCLYYNNGEYAQLISYEPPESDEISGLNIKMWEDIFKAESEDAE